MNEEQTEYVVGTSGYSFPDWVGPFYPPHTRQGDMLACYARHFAAVEINFTFYQIPALATIERMAAASPPGFLFWVKANQQFTHEQDLSNAPAFLDALSPMSAAGKLSGVLLQYPQSFHRTLANRKALAAATAAMSSVPLAVEFRHRSWDDAATLESLRQRNLTLVVPDVPKIGDLYAPPPLATSNTAYLRLHSRNAEKWYAGMAERYDYSYSDQEMREILQAWSGTVGRVDRVYAMFNNCHRGQAAQNAESFRRILGQIT